MLPDLKYLNMIYDYFKPIVTNLKEQSSSASPDINDEPPPSPFTYWKDVSTYRRSNPLRFSSTLF